MGVSNDNQSVDTFHPHAVPLSAPSSANMVVSSNNSSTNVSRNNNSSANVASLIQTGIL